jgi:hypothetical protein
MRNHVRSSGGHEVSKEGFLYHEGKRKKEQEQIQARAVCDQARTVSRDCAYCGGHGMVTVYHHRYRGSSINQSRETKRLYAATTAAHCRCQLGQWIRDRCPPELAQRIPWVEAILQGRSDWVLDIPERHDFPCNWIDEIPPRDFPDGPECPVCRQSMMGGSGGMPWTCFRGCPKELVDKLQSIIAEREANT